MAKKIAGFIVIFLAYCIIGASVVIATFNFGLGYFDDSRADSYSYAYALDRAGDVYYINDVGGTKSLVCVDSMGKLMFSEVLDPEIFGGSFYINEIFIGHDRKIFITVCEFDRRSLFVNNVSIHSFFEDGTYVDRIFSQETRYYPNFTNNVISSLSDNDQEIFFAVMNDGGAEVFCAPKNNSAPPYKIAGYDLGGTELSAVYAAPSGELYAARGSEITLYSSEGSRSLLNKPGAVFDRFWHGIGSVYAVDRASGDIYAIASGDGSVTAAASGGRIVNAEENLTIMDFHEVAVGTTGNILGAFDADSSRIYTGSFALMSRIDEDTTDTGSVFSRILTLAGTAAAVILLTVLTWDFYCSILKMRLSILLRQSLLIAMLIFVSLYSLSYLVVIPHVENVAASDGRHEVKLAAEALCEAVYAEVENEYGTADGEGLEKHLEIYGRKAASDGEDSEKPQIYILEPKARRMVVTASSTLYPAGYPAERLILGGELEQAADSSGKEIYRIDRSRSGKLLIMVKMLPDGRYLAAVTRVTELEKVIYEIKHTVNVLLAVIGAALIVFFVIIENITAGAVRKLKKAVDKITLGQYDTPVNIRSGDEVEELALSVRSLANHIIDKTASLEKLNNSYYRFVPLAFLKTLGETKIENVGKSLNSKRTMTVMFLRFELERSITGMRTDEIFGSINSVFEQIIPVIHAYDGTAYNFLFNGFSAIFPEDPEKAMQAAIRIREVVNAAGGQENAGKADVRIVLSRGEVLLGFIGDEMRMEPIAVSTAITQSEEAERLCKSSGMYIVCFDSVFDHLPKDKYRSRCVGVFCTEDGEPHRIYDMFDSDPYSLVKLKEQFMLQFQLGVRLFEKGDYYNARATFMDIAKYSPDDGVARNYLYLAEHNVTYDHKNTTYTVYNG